MALIPIICIPDPVLREVAAPVGEVTDGVRRLLDDMVETMYDAPGIGLAAPQVNVSERLIVMDCGADDSPELYKMINPEIIARSEDSAILEEGCLSIPKQTAEVKRPAVVDVRYTDIEGAEQTLRCESLLAACVQHEIDHLDGVLFIDHISRLKRDMIVRRALKELRQVNGGDQG
ncbi:MAG: peptide deformylase [Pseudomonadota bacterium]|nr:peptide deformylase [Pseudomonadota bacterium]MEC9141741.1 peptide deformylase [Pseudomonadota bacterium]